jgi:hypothetical protein
MRRARRTFFVVLVHGLTEYNAGDQEIRFPCK